MVKGTLLFLLLVLLSEVGSAQSKNLAEKQQIVDAIGKNYNSGSVQTFNERYEGVKGSPFLSDEWMDGEVRLTNGQKFDDLQLKYDVYRDEIIVRRRDGAEVIPDKHTIVSFLLTTTEEASVRRFLRVDYLANSHKYPNNHFSEVLHEGTSTLLATRHKKLIRADYRGAYHANRPYDRFGDVMTQYYWINPRGQASGLKPTSKSILRLFNDKKQRIKTYLENHPVDFANEQEVVQLVQYYDQQ